MFARSSSRLLGALGALGAASLSLFGAVGCGGTTTPATLGGSAGDDPGQVQSALDETNGGLTTTNEQPEFDDPQVHEIATFSTNFSDTMDVAPAATSPAPAPAAGSAYRIALVWGHLPPPHDEDATDVAPIPLDWSGTISVASGLVGVKRTLAFEADDHIDPRVSASTLSFGSHTLPATDGVLLRVVLPAGASTQLDFATGPLTTSIDLSQLGAQEGGVVRLSDQADGLFWIGFPEDGCPRGFLFGHWRKLVPGVGAFRGRVFDGDGVRIGDLRGIWGHAPRLDENVFFGKTIGVDGSYHGLVGGTYGAGAFHGVWGTVDPSNDGTLEGFYADGYGRDEDDQGTYVGRWSEACH